MPPNVRELIRESGVLTTSPPGAHAAPIHSPSSSSSSSSAAPSQLDASPGPSSSSSSSSSASRSGINSVATSPPAASATSSSSSSERNTTSFSAVASPPNAGAAPRSSSSSSSSRRSTTSISAPSARLGASEVPDSSSSSSSSSSSISNSSTHPAAPRPSSSVSANDTSARGARRGLPIFKGGVAKPISISTSGISQPPTKNGSSSSRPSSSVSAASSSRRKSTVKSTSSSSSSCSSSRPGSSVMPTPSSSSSSRSTSNSSTARPTAPCHRASMFRTGADHSARHVILSGSSRRRQDSAHDDAQPKTKEEKRAAQRPGAPLGQQKKPVSYGFELPPLEPAKPLERKLTPAQERRIDNLLADLRAVRQIEWQRKLSKGIAASSHQSVNQFQARDRDNANVPSTHPNINEMNAWPMQAATLSAGGFVLNTQASSRDARDALLQDQLQRMLSQQPRLVQMQGDAAMRAQRMRLAQLENDAALARNLYHTELALAQQASVATHGIPFVQPATSSSVASAHSSLNQAVTPSASNSSDGAARAMGMPHSHIMHPMHSAPVSQLPHPGADLHQDSSPFQGFRPNVSAPALAPGDLHTNPYLHAAAAASSMSTAPRSSIPTGTQSVSNSAVPFAGMLYPSGTSTSQSSRHESSSSQGYQPLVSTTPMAPANALVNPVLQCAAFSTVRNSSIPAGAPSSSTRDLPSMGYPRGSSHQHDSFNSSQQHQSHVGATTPSPFAHAFTPGALLTDPMLPTATNESSRGVPLREDFSSQLQPPNSNVGAASASSLAPATAAGGGLLANSSFVASSAEFNVDMNSGGGSGAIGQITAPSNAGDSLTAMSDDLCVFVTSSTASSLLKRVSKSTGR